jgi:aldehyde dehydrogenase (NAD+)
MGDFSCTNFGKHSNFIGGKEVPAISGATYVTKSPANDVELGTAAKSGPADVDAAIVAAKSAQKEWWARPVSEREEILLKCASAIEANTAALARVLMWDSGSIKGKAMMEVTYSASLFRTAAGEARRLYGDTFPNDKPHRMSIVIREPLGIVAVVSPFNAPMILCVKSVAFALACGNAVVQKPSTETPLVTVHLARILHRAGLPAGLFNVVTGPSGAIGDYICGHPEVQSVGFTGSTDVGIRVGEVAARTMKRTHLELGGKNPLLVLRDIKNPGVALHMDAAVQQALSGAFYHCGQICMASSRIIVERSVADEFFTKLKARADALVVSPALDDDDVAFGPVINKKALDKILEHVDEARRAGAEVLCGGELVTGLCYRPTIIRVDSPTQAVIWKEETFGPVVVALVVDSLDDAIAAANDTEFGLSAAVLTNDMRSAMRCVREIHAGSVHVGMHSFQSDALAPVGGTKMSGIGKTGGKYGLDHFSELKWAAIELGEAPVPPAFAPRSSL